MSDELKKLHEERNKIKKELELRDDNDMWELWNDLYIVEGEIDLLENEK